MIYPYLSDVKMFIILEYKIMGVVQSSMCNNTACIESYINKAKRRMGSHGELNIIKA